MAVKNQQEWFKKFYEGTFLVKGWKARMEEILKGFPPDRREEMKGLLDDLGKKIGMEWAKDNAVRKIDTPQLQRWGDGLKKAKSQGPDALTAHVQKLREEVDEKIA